MGPSHFPAISFGVISAPLKTETGKDPVVWPEVNNGAHNRTTPDRPDDWRSLC